MLSNAIGRAATVGVNFLPGPIVGGWANSGAKMEGLLKFRVLVDDQNPSTVQMDLGVEHRAVFANGATVEVLSLDAAQPQDKGSVQPTANNSDYAAAFRDINDIINSTNYSMSKYSQIVEVMKRLNAPGAVRRS